MPGFWRSVYYQLGWEYNSNNDIPKEDDVKLKQVCMRQISLSKVKLKHVETKERTPPDLEKIKVNEEFKINYKNKRVIVYDVKTEIKSENPFTPNNSPWSKSKTKDVLFTSNNIPWIKSKTRIF